jgi:hypothetical protein
MFFAAEDLSMIFSGSRVVFRKRVCALLGFLLLFGKKRKSIREQNPQRTDRMLLPEILKKNFGWENPKVP